METIIAKRCMGCGRVYKNSPTVEYEDGHGGRFLEMCSCGCDLFAAFEAQLHEGQIKGV